MDKQHNALPDVTKQDAIRLHKLQLLHGVYVDVFIFLLGKLEALEEDQDTRQL